MSIERAVSAAYEYLAETSPENTAVIPIAFSLEIETDANGRETQTWWAYLTIKDAYWGEVESASEHPDLATAIRRAVVGMQRQTAPKLLIA